MKIGSKRSLVCHCAYLPLLIAFAAQHNAIAAPVETVLYNFGVIKAGSNPQAALTPGPNGVYYGTTDGGGATGNGTVFEFIPPSGDRTAWIEKVIYSFTGAADGSDPSSGVLVDKSGAIYGVTGGGGEHGAGVVFKLTPPAKAGQEWTDATLFVFNGGSDGNAPFGTLIADGNGVLYGSTAGGGGSSGGGVVFSLTPPQAGGTAWAETVLHRFRGGNDGASPSAGLLRDAASGVIFGMTSVGGTNNGGTAFSLTPPADGGADWNKVTLYDFGAFGDGSFPVGGLVEDAAGVLYGVTNGGSPSPWGTVFSLTAPAAGKKKWVEKELYQFKNGVDGGAPDSTLVLDPSGTLYGTTNSGGSAGEGAAFALTPPASAKADWTETTLASFTGPNGNSPVGLTRDASGVLLGVTFFGGTRGNGGGTIFTLTPPQPGDSTWTQDVIHQFAATSTDAVSPIGGLLAGKAGIYYGSANRGGIHGDGAVYALSPPEAGQTAWTDKVLYSFNGRDGNSPIGKLVAGPNGVLYGVTSGGGPDSDNSYGVVYALIPPASGQTEWTERVIHSFKGVASGDGAFPQAGLIIDSTGALYGTVAYGGVATSDDSFGAGIVFKLEPPTDGKNAWKEKVLYRFTGPDGGSPNGTLLLDKTGVMYGTTYVGGSAGEGTVFSLTPPSRPNGSWAENVLHSFDVSVGNDGAIPGAEQLVEDTDGALYGTASQGGAGNSGAVFKLSPPAGTATGWTETLLHSFTGTDGASPYVGLLAKKNGTLFGVTEQGGAYRGGTVFKLTPAGGGATYTSKVLHEFNPTYGADGADAAGALIAGAKGALLGTAATGGYGNSGVIFEVTP